VDHFIRALKFHQQLELARLLGEQLARRLAQETPPDLIIPVPLHGTRLRERGYNQALEIARPVARVLGVPLDFRSLVRVRATAPQTGMAVAARRMNAQCLIARSAALNGQHGPVDDDDYWGTAEAAATLRRRSGKNEIWWWRAPEPAKKC
jgi:predicted amidophosphoribosyltransferase